MQPTQTKLALVPTVGSRLSGPRASNSTTPKRDSGTRPSAANPAVTRSATSASEEILRARDLLRDVLLRDDESDELALIGQVSAGLNEIVCTLDSLAGLQRMFEVWSR
jgi:hypothetical protein